MEIVIDFSHFINFFYAPFSEAFWDMVLFFGLPIFLVMSSIHAYIYWHITREDAWKATHKFVLLALDIPRGNEQTPKAVENMLSHLSGTLDPLTMVEKSWYGMFFLPISLEVISIEGYIQFLIQTPDKYRNLVESAVYSQYPGAEITEVSDYTEGMPRKFPDDEYDIRGTEFMHANNQAFPIKTYKDFEHIISDTEVQFKDPMATLMELFNSAGPGEQFWYQVLIEPEQFEWPKMGEIEIRRILKEKGLDKKHFGDFVVEKFVGALDVVSSGIYRLLGGEPSELEDDDKPLKMLELNPIEKEQVEAIAEKTAKYGFKTKVRFIHIAPKENFNKIKGMSGAIGFMRQFVRMHLNGLKPDTKLTMTRNSHLYFFKNLRLNMRKNNIINNYRVRSATNGRYKTVLNTEEIATLWHFPAHASIKAPLLQKVLGKKSEPPATLPTISELNEDPDLIAQDIKEDNFELVQEPEEEKIEDSTGTPPSNLPV